MDLKLLLVITLSLGMIALILGFSWWLIQTSKEEAKNHQGIPKNAEPWLKVKSIFGWLSLLVFLGLIFRPIPVLAGLFLTVLGAHYLCYGVLVYWVQALESLGFGITYYGKAAKVMGGIIFAFGAFIFLIGVGGLGIMLVEEITL